MAWKFVHKTIIGAHNHVNHHLTFAITCLDFHAKLTDIFIYYASSLINLCEKMVQINTQMILISCIIRNACTFRLLILDMR